MENLDEYYGPIINALDSFFPQRLLKPMKDDFVTFINHYRKQFTPAEHLAFRENIIAENAPYSDFFEGDDLTNTQKSVTKVEDSVYRDYRKDRLNRDDWREVKHPDDYTGTELTEKEKREWERRSQKESQTKPQKYQSIVTPNEQRELIKELERNGEPLRILREINIHNGFHPNDFLSVREDFNDLQDADDDFPTNKGDDQDPHFTPYKENEGDVRHPIDYNTYPRNEREAEEYMKQNGIVPQITEYESDDLGTIGTQEDRMSTRMSLQRAIVAQEAAKTTSHPASVLMRDQDNIKDLFGLNSLTGPLDASKEDQKMEIEETPIVPVEEQDYSLGGCQDRLKNLQQELDNNLFILDKIKNKSSQTESDSLQFERSQARIVALIDEIEFYQSIILSREVLGVEGEGSGT